jgi:hypothetical protein
LNQEDSILERLDCINLKDVFFGTSPDYAAIGMKPGIDHLSIEYFNKNNFDKMGISLEKLLISWDQRFERTNIKVKDNSMSLQSLNNNKQLFELEISKLKLTLINVNANIIDLVNQINDLKINQNNLVNQINDLKINQNKPKHFIVNNFIKKIILIIVINVKKYLSIIIKLILRNKKIKKNIIYILNLLKIYDYVKKILLNKNILINEKGNETLKIDYKYNLSTNNIFNILKDNNNNNKY